MAGTPLSELFGLSARARADLAMALWESLSPDPREAELSISPEVAGELERRWREHAGGPDTAVAWEDVLRRLRAE